MIILVMDICIFTLVFAWSLPRPDFPANLHRAEDFTEYILIDKCENLVITV